MCDRSPLSNRRALRWTVGSNGERQGEAGRCGGAQQRKIQVEDTTLPVDFLFSCTIASSAPTSFSAGAGGARLLQMSRLNSARHRKPRVDPHVWRRHVPVPGKLGDDE
jgi:hypothetical protein